ncbi:hypothetical protein J6590_034823 [Homalodisca vitripennis]|nr:hypothetical protein J6590_034823 [Homalodisca vitripennis]
MTRPSKSAVVSEWVSNAFQRRPKPRREGTEGTRKYRQGTPEQTLPTTATIRVQDRRAGSGRVGGVCAPGGRKEVINGKRPGDLTGSQLVTYNAFEVINYPLPRLIQ